MHLRRKIDGFLMEWKASADKKPLIIKGARQVGKTESVLCFPAQAVSFGRGFLGGGVIV